MNKGLLRSLAMEQAMGLSFSPAKCESKCEVPLFCDVSENYTEVSGAVTDILKDLRSGDDT